MRIPTLALALLVISACSAEDPMPPETNRLKPDHAPTPFSADEIRAGCPPGRVITWRVTATDLPAPMLQTFTFDESKTGKAVFRATMTTEDGAPKGAARTASVAWKDLQAHASYPAARTTITGERIETEGGTFDCWLYTVRDAANPDHLETEAWFAKDLPGPPVRLKQYAEGKVVRTMELLETKR